MRMHRVREFDAQVVCHADYVGIRLGILRFSATPEEAEALAVKLVDMAEYCRRQAAVR